MGSILKGIAGDKIYMQFVPGVVVEVVTSDLSLRSIPGTDSIGTNSIIAKPHFYDGKKPLNKDLNEKYRYWPLLRGFADVPTKGDPVLLCTIGGVNQRRVTLESKRGESKNFEKVPHKRLQKHFNDDLDNPVISLDGTRANANPNLNEIHGDMLLEGRHGNSIRIGSRYVNPYIMISNGRNPQASIESGGDDSLISITTYGTLTQHFGSNSFSPISLQNKNEDDNPTAELGNPDVPDVPTMSSINGFKLVTEKNQVVANPVDYVPNGTIINLMKSFYKLDHMSVERTLHNWIKGQTLIQSPRVTIHSTESDTYLSSGNDLYLAAVRSVGLTSTEDIILESRNILLGNPYKNGTRIAMEPLVMGQQLFSILDELLTVLSDAHGLVQSVAVPLTDKTGTPKSFSENIKRIKGKLGTMLSEKHYVEPNKNQL